jgi:hypothetical protein
MFHMTNDSGLFLKAADLKKQGWIPGECNQWIRGDERAVPLYEGKMVQMFDHRAADVVVHAGNLHRAAQQEAIPDQQKTSTTRLPPTSTASRSTLFCVKSCKARRSIYSSWSSSPS